MARKPPKLPHVKFVRTRDKLGYYAYFNTGVKADGKPVYVPLPKYGSTGFFDSYATRKAERTKRSTAAYTVGKMVDDWQRSPDYAKKAVSTRKIYDLTLRQVEDAFGKFPVNRVTPERVYQYLGTLEETPGRYNLTAAVMRSLYRWGRRNGKANINPVQDVKPLEIAEHTSWPADVLEAALSAKEDRVRLATHLLFYTGQRIGDVIKMRWSDIKENSIRVTQQKTGKHLLIPLHEALRDMLATFPKEGITILVSQRGQPMTDQTVRIKMKAFAASMGHNNLVPHGIRKNAVEALLEAGCTVAETASVSGQSYRMVEKYARRIDQQHLSKAAILKFENTTGTGKQTGKRVTKTA
jgi:integrase